MVACNGFCCVFQIQIADYFLLMDYSNPNIELRSQRRSVVPGVDRTAALAVVASHQLTGYYPLVLLGIAAEVAKNLAKEMPRVVNQFRALS